ncbi:MAG TPA: ATP-binding protein [Holophaga sp.]|nr:ATP-binding protein [Holophaga sp.]HPS67691.1 ATP-binding protein [Holophaga sp.]
MRFRVRTKLFLVSLGLIILALLLSDLYLSPRVDRLLVERVKADLLVRSRLMEVEAAELFRSPARGSIDAWEQLAKTLGRRASARVTLVSREGQVLGDSSLDEPAVSHLESHGDRPEVIAALARGEGAAIRYSSTLQRRMMYVSRSFAGADGRVAGAVRVALPLSDVDDSVWQFRKLVFSASILALVAAALLSTATAHWVSSSLRAMAQAAASMLKGDLDTRTRAHGTDELAELGQALDLLAANLRDAMRDLRSERDLLGGILASMQEGVLVVDQDGRIVHMNPAVRSTLLLGEEALGRPLIEIIRNADLVEMLDRARGGAGRASVQLESGGVKPRYLLAHASPLPDRPGDMLLVLVDVTDLRRLESIRKDFVANASHELRTPVASIRSAAETLRSALDDPEAALGFVEILERNSERLQRLVEDLLDLSRIESREYALRLERIDLPGFLDGILPLHLDRFRRKDMPLAADVPVGTKVKADRRALEMIFSNLLDNAAKYCPAGTSVRIEAEALTDKVRVTVADQGPGIPPQHLPRIFERFYRVDAGRSRDLGGTGLGLAIVKHLAEAMGGTAGVESLPGQGARFSITLPDR